MNILHSFKNDLFYTNKNNFEERALAVFIYQASNNSIYNLFLKNLKINPGTVYRLEDIPFMPIEFFKNHEIVTNTWVPRATFESSGTGGQITSKHYIEDPAFYLSVARNIFFEFYGPLEEFHILALLPSYLERKNSSLVAMVSHFMDQSKSNHSGFYLNNVKELVKNLEQVKSTPRKTLLIGVTFALLDLAQEYELDLKGTMVMETGGMKGRREEVTRKEVHQILKSKLNLTAVHSEYGMTELLSQAYAPEEGKLHTPPWMKVMIRDLNDPFTYLDNNRNGGINIIDLANVHSCSFIETSDIGITRDDGTFEVLGRFDNSDLRGCNLMVF
jgi:hypothetical protein